MQMVFHGSESRTHNWGNKYSAIRSHFSVREEVLLGDQIQSLFWLCNEESIS